MKTNAAVLWGVGEQWSIEGIDIGEPTARAGLAECKADRLCHSEEHIVTGDMVLPDAYRTAAGMPSPSPWSAVTKAASSARSAPRCTASRPATSYPRRSSPPAAGANSRHRPPL